MHDLPGKGTPMRFMSSSRSDTPPKRLSKQSGWIASFSLISLILAILACTSNDTLFIQLTPTPVPSITPTPLAAGTRFKIKDKAYVISSTIQVLLTAEPGPLESQPGATTICFPNTLVEVSDVSKNQKDPKDLTIYYKVSCAASDGWVPEYWMTPLDPAGSAVVKSKDGKGAKIYSDTNTRAELASPTPCADGTTVVISKITLNLDSTTSAPDRNIYVQITCGNTTGYVLDSELIPA
jgi:hypothetical protein